MGFYDSTKVGSPDDTVELDLTNSHLPNLQGVEIKPTLQYVDLTANRLKAIDERLLALPGTHSVRLLTIDLKFLCFRQNLLADASVVARAACKHSLEELYINDNHLKEIPDLTGFKKLRRLEFSYNHEIRSLQPLEHVEGANMVELYSAENKITAIEAISHLTNLTVLELGSNRIKEIQNLETLKRLQQLWLGRNRITEIANLSALTLVRQLSLQANRLESMTSISVMVGLEELYLSQNGIKKIEGLEPLTKLVVLDLAMNQIEMVQGLDKLERLTDLWLNDNPVKDLDHIDAAVQSCKNTLTVVYLENTPAAKSTTAYLHIMKQMLPKLEYLDSTPIAR